MIRQMILPEAIEIGMTIWLPEREDHGMEELTGKVFDIVPVLFRTWVYVDLIEGEDDGIHGDICEIPLEESEVVWEVLS